MVEGRRLTEMILGECIVEGRKEKVESYRIVWYHMRFIRKLLEESAYHPLKSPITAAAPPPPIGEDLSYPDSL